MDKRILLSHGSAGYKTDALIKEIFLKHLGNQYLEKLPDSSILDLAKGKIAFTTDSYVIEPLFFPGGDIGKLAVCGTVNDLAVSGAVPKYLSAGFIIEEGLETETLERIVISMAAEAKNAGVNIVTGDTKVLNKGKGDKLFINTAGIGLLQNEYSLIGEGKMIKPGNHIIINGALGNHAIAVMMARENIGVGTPVRSDCASLNGLTSGLLRAGKVNFMRDLTRGGLATVLNEVTTGSPIGMRIYEENIPVDTEVAAACELLGFDPLYLANEGKLVAIVDKDSSKQVIETMRTHPLGKNASVIGEVVRENIGKVLLETCIGGLRIVDKLTGDQLPRIC